MSSADPETAAYAGLNQPRLQSSNSVVLGEAKKQMRRENKQRRQALRAEQTLVSPWTQHKGLGDTITPTDHKACPPHRNFMCPNGLALQHPAAELLKEWPQSGAPHVPAHHGRRKRCGRQSPEVCTSQPDHPTQIHILKLKLRRKCKQIKCDWCYGSPSKTIPQKSSRYLRSRPSHTNPSIPDPSWTYLSACALRIEGSEPQ